MRPAAAALVALSLAPCALAADTVTRREYCMSACRWTLQSVPFTGHPNATEGFWQNACANELKISSIVLCARTYCSAGDLAFAYARVRDTCEAQAAVRLPVDEAEFQVPEGPVREVRQGEVLERVDGLAVPTRAYWGVAMDTMVSWYDTRRAHALYSSAMFAYWLVLMILAALVNLASYVASTMAPRRIPVPTALLSLFARLRGYIIDPPTLTHRCATPYGQATIPPRLETAIISVFILLNVILSCVSYTIVPVSLFVPTPAMQATRYFSDRTGFLSYANLAIAWLFGMRNNLLISLTGWSFTTFTRFHRWVARVAAVHAILHSVGYSVYSVCAEGWVHYYGNFLIEYWYTGVIATVCLSLMLPASILWLRHRHYEVFLMLHVALAITSLVTLFYHTKIFGGAFDWYLYICVFVWVLDRVMRIGRTALAAKRATSLDAVVEYIPGADLLRIDVTDLIGRAASSIPDECFYYIYAPHSLFFWQSHPFSLVRWEEQLSVQDGDYAVSETDTTTLLVDSKPALQTRHSFLVRPYRGFTRRLLPRGQSLTYQTRLLLEGPYSSPPRLTHCPRILLIMGGSGIAAGVSAAYHVLEAVPHARIQLVWAVRSAALLEAIVFRELRCALESGRLVLDAYITRTSSDTVAPKVAGACRRLLTHRPDVSALIADAAEASDEELGVVVCGPPRMTDDVRAAVVREESRGQGVWLFVETFNW